MPLTAFATELELSRLWEPLPNLLHTANDIGRSNIVREQL
jgi:hypothetical protein